MKHLQPLGTRALAQRQAAPQGPQPPPLPDLDILVVLYGHKPRRAASVAATFAHWDHYQSPMPRALCAWCYREGEEPPELATMPDYPWLVKVRLPQYDLEDGVFRKEALLNYLLNHHATAPYLLTLDADVWTPERGWFRRIRDKLAGGDPRAVFQPWASFEDTVEKHTRWSWSAQCLPESQKTQCRHPGLGWAFTWAWFVSHDGLRPFNPWQMCGSGDGVFIVEHFENPEPDYLDPIRLPRTMHALVRKSMPKALQACIPIHVYHEDHTDNTEVPSQWREFHYADRGYRWGRLSLDFWGDTKQHIFLDRDGVPMIRDPQGPFACCLARKAEMQDQESMERVISESKQGLTAAPPQTPSKPWHEITGFFSALDATVNQWLVDQCRPDGVIVVLGVYHGRSTAHLCETLAAKGKRNVRIICVDLFTKGMMEEAAKNLQGDFRIEFVRSDSTEAAKRFGKGEVDGVFIDASHDPIKFAEDVDAWRSKVRTGGLLCGHDYSKNCPGLVAAVDRRFAGRLRVVGKSWAVTAGAAAVTDEKYRIANSTVLETLGGIGDHLMLLGVVNHLQREAPKADITVHLTRPGLEPWFREVCPGIKFTEHRGTALPWLWRPALPGRHMVELYGAKAEDIRLARPKALPRKTTALRIAFAGVPNPYLPLKTWPHWDRLAELVEERYGVAPFRIGVDTIADPVHTLPALLDSMDKVVCTEGMVSHLAWAIRKRVTVLVPGAIEASALAYPGWHTVLQNPCPVTGQHCHRYTNNLKGVGHQHDGPVCSGECMSSFLPETVLAAMETKPRIVNVHFLSKNCGDANCGPSHYFPGMEERSTSQPAVPCDIAIFGGGGVYQDCVYRRAQQYRELGARIVIWGAGIVTEDREAGMTPQSWRVFGDLADLTGVREDSPWLLVPCPSCMSGLFDRLSTVVPEYDTVYYDHPDKTVGPGTPRMTNYDTTDLETVLRFLASGKEVVTSSYHGRIWATWLGRKVRLAGRAAPMLSLSGAVPPLALARLTTVDFHDMVKALCP